MGYDPKIHHRKSIRLKGYDYARAGLYFITLCVQNRAYLFGNISDGRMHLNAYGQIAKEEWENTGIIRKNCTIEEFIIMPDHFHAILSIDYAIKKTEDIGVFKSPSQTIGAIIRGYKGATTKRIKGLIRDNNPNISSAGELQFAPTEFAPTEFGLKGQKSTKTIDLSKSIWQRDYYESIIRDERAYLNIKNYIINNPTKWENDKFNRK